MIRLGAVALGAPGVVGTGGTGGRGTVGGRADGPAWPALPLRLDRPGPCAHIPTLTVFLLDGSGSVTSRGGNDPLGRRLDEVWLAMRHLGRSCRCRAELAAVVHFDPGGHDRGPEPLTRAGLRLLGEALVVPVPGTGSDLGPSLGVAARLAADRPDHRATVVVLSDFELFDPDVGAVLDRFAAFPGDSHAVVLSGRAPAQLARDPRTQVTPIAWDSPPGAVARAVLTSLAAHRAPR